MYAQKKPIDNAHIVRERDRERFRELLAVLLLAAPLGLFLLLFTWQNLEVIRLGREATELRGVRDELEQSNRKLRLHVQKMTALGEVERQARERGFAPAAPNQVVTVRLAPGDQRAASGGGARR
ncbi:MAG: hypothetical protein ACRD2J_15575 [Thermoanaerobaculia bacterium]